MDIFLNVLIAHFNSSFTGYSNKLCTKNAGNDFLVSHNELCVRHISDILQIFASQIYRVDNTSISRSQIHVPMWCERRDEFAKAQLRKHTLHTPTCVKCALLSLSRRLRLFIVVCSYSNTAYAIFHTACKHTKSMVRRCLCRVRVLHDVDDGDRRIQGKQVYI